MQENSNRYFIINKPFDMVSQFVSPHDVKLLGDLDFPFPPGIHAVGRLDINSEGLLILTTNKKLTNLLFLSQVPHQRTYLVQVNNHVSEQKIQQLRKGVPIKIKTGVHFTTSPCYVELITDTRPFCIVDEKLSAYPPFTWLMITITEGKFRQVRKMIYAIRHKCKRLIRVSIEGLYLGNLKPGEVLEMGEEEIFEKLQIPLS